VSDADKYLGLGLTYLIYNLNKFLLEDKRYNIKISI
jgi:hypothetical protein